MAMRQSRPRTRAHTTNSDTRTRLDPDNIKNWDVATLRLKLEEINISLAGNVNRKTLIMLYQANVVSRSMTRDRSAVSQSGQRTHPTSSFPESRQMLDNNLAEFSLDEMAKDLRADNNIATPSDIRTSSAVSAEHRPSSTSVTTTMAALHSEMRKLTDLVRTSQTTGDPIQSAKPPDSLPMIPDMVTPALRRQIVED